MQNMMSAMFQYAIQFFIKIFNRIRIIFYFDRLRDLKRIHLKEAGKDEEKSPLQRLVEQIAQDITACRSNLAYYSKRKFICQLIFFFTGATPYNCL